MKAAYLTRYGSHETFTLGDLPTPVLEPGSVLVKVMAAAVNPVEIALRNGDFKRTLRFRFPLVMGFDVSGVVLQVAPGIRGWEPGDAVFARLPNRRMGAYAEFAVIPADLLAPKPRNASHLEAASLPTVALTAWQGLVERAGLKPSERILIQAGAGGVGSIAIQLAKHLGATVTATAGPRNIEYLQDLGADQAVDYTRRKFEEAGPFDVVYDGVGGELIERSIDTLAPGGRYVGLVRTADARSYRELGLPAPLAWLASRRIAPFQKRARRLGAQFHGVLTRPDGAALTRIAQLVETGALRPQVGQTFPLAQLSQAFEEIAKGHTRGKIVIEIAQA